MLVRGAPLIGAAAAYGMALAMRGRSLRRGARARLRGAAGDAPDGGQPALGARRHARALRRCRRPSARRGGLRARRRDLRRGCRRSAAHRRPRPGADHRALQPRTASAGQRADPLQRRLARHRRLGHRAGADLPRARRRHPDPCLGRRDPAAQPGRQPDRLGARQARRAAHRDRRQCRRPPDAARQGRSRASSAPTARRARGDVCNKIGTYLKALAAHDNGVPFYVGLPCPTIDWTIEDGVANPDRGARRRTRSRASPAAPRARSPPSTRCPKAARPPTPPST